jgi:hypothetical protein
MTPMARLARRIALVAVLVAEAGCTGRIQDGPTREPNSRPTAGTPDPQDPVAPPSTGDSGPACDPARRSFAPARLWQLTDKQYVNVVRDVLGIALSDEDGRIVSAGAPDRYTNYSEGSAIDTQVAPNYQTAAARVADLSEGKLVELLGSARPTASQVRAFIDDKIARAWRRPVTPVEQAALLKMYTDAQPDGPARGLHLVIEAALQAGSFLYRTELGKGAASATGPVALGPFELASALSFLFLETSPDDLLWARAQAGTLTDANVLAAEVDRLMAMPAARANLAMKASYWLGLAGIANRSRSNALYPEWKEALKVALARSVQLFVDEVVGSGKLGDLFTSNRMYVNESLARLYGIPGVRGSDLVAVAVAGGQRSAGILSQPGLIVAANKSIDRADVVHRGLLVNDAFICGGAIPPAPPEAGDEAKKMDGTERDRANARAMKPGCVICHVKFDQPGLTFERYDALGRYQENRQAVLDSMTGVTSWQTTSQPIDTSAVLADDGQGGALAGPVAGLDELAARLAASPQRVGLCATRKLAEYALGYDPEAQSSCELQAVKDVLVKTGSFTAFFRALALSPGFRTRNPLPVAGP